MKKKQNEYIVVNFDTGGWSFRYSTTKEGAAKNYSKDHETNEELDLLVFPTTHGVRVKMKRDNYFKIENVEAISE